MFNLYKTKLRKKPVSALKYFYIFIIIIKFKQKGSITTKSSVLCFLVLNINARLFTKLNANYITILYTSHTSHTQNVKW